MTRDDARLRKLLDASLARLREDVEHLSSMKYRRISSSN